MATYAVGDIHGNARALDDVLRAIGPLATSGDSVVFLGDYIDRGRDSRRVIDLVLAFRNRSAATVATLLGNHEEWLLKMLDDFTSHSWLLAMEAWATIESYSPPAALALKEEAKAAGPSLYSEGVPLNYDRFVGAMPAEHLSFLRALLPYCR